MLMEVRSLSFDAAGMTEADRIETLRIIWANAEPIQHVRVGGAYMVPLIPGRRGFRNLGNTCFANSIFQALGHSRVFRSAVRDRLVRLAVKKAAERASLDPQSLPTATEEFLRIVDDEMMNTQEFIAIDASEFMKRIRREHPGEFNSFAQEDANHFFNAVIEGLYQLDPQLLNSLFHIPIVSEDLCRNCGDSIRSSDPGTDGTHAFKPVFELSCPDADVKSLEACFATNSAWEVLRDSSGINPLFVCEDCYGQPYERRVVLGDVNPQVSLLGPEIMYIQIKRNVRYDKKTDQFGTVRMDATYVAQWLEFPLTFQLEQMPGASNVRGFYTLASVVLLESQHYTTVYIDIITGQWLTANDSRVEPIELPTLYTDNMARSKSVYALVYERVNDIHAPSF